MQRSTDSHSGAGSPPAMSPMRDQLLDKDLATLIAKAAIGEVAVTPSTNDREQRVFIVTRWSLTRECATLDEVRELLTRMGVEV